MSAEHTTRRFFLVDVFNSGPLNGNPLAVVRDADGLDTDAMLALTRWLNFSETTFLLPPTTPEADYRVRIFTPDREMPFAGHPTLGSCHVWLATGGQPRTPGRIVQECGVGLVPIRQEGARLAFAAPPLLRRGAVDAATRAEVLRLLQIDDAAVIDMQWADNGPGWVLACLPSAAEVLALKPAGQWPHRIDVGVVGPHAAGADTAFEVRAFFTDQLGLVREDPVTGSLNASTAQWLFSTGRAQGSYVAAQGHCLGRRGRVYATQDADGTVWIGGTTGVLSEGLCQLPG